MSLRCLANGQKELPSTILNLNLTSFHAHPNPFHTRRSQDEEEREKPKAVPTVEAASGRVLGPLDSTAEQSVPRLYNICLNMLISPRAPSNLPPLLDQYEWEAPAKGHRHPLLDADELVEIIPSIRRQDMICALQALKSAGHAYASSGSSNARPNLYGSLGLARTGAIKVDPFPRSHRPSPPDDASTNPYFYPCPSPRHLEYDENADGNTVRPTRHLFVHAVEERLEWRDLFDAGQLPIRWKGCSPGCLDFLEEEEEDWGLDEEDEDAW